MLVIDTVKLAPRTELEAWERWLNRMQSELLSLPYYHKRKIEVKGETEAEAIARRTKDWPKHDPNPNHCTGRGHSQCMRDGEHSWFNHSQDGLYGDLPTGFTEPV